MPKFKIIGEGTIISAGEEYRAGDVLELPAHVALEFKGQLEPADAEAELVFNDPVPLDLKNRRAHERESILRERQQKLKEQLESVEKLLLEFAAPAAPAPKPKK